MKNFYLFFILFFIFPSDIFSQDNTSGRITYELVIDYNLEEFTKRIVQTRPQMKAFFDRLPKKGKSFYDLSFNENGSFYEESLSENEPPPRHMQWILGRMSYGKPPKAEIKKVFTDVKKNKKIETYEFMTRNFMVESDLTNFSWKINNKMKKVGDYVCLGAEIKEGDDHIIAWFTSQIPISIGPLLYRGLPGAILAIEKNEKIIILAKNIDLTNLDGVVKPEAGKKYTKEKFGRVIAEKTEEFLKTQTDGSSGATGGGYSGGQRRIRN
tara:strand:+ start:1169 stop:1972 length:804 start_codon:yes stop_codon:yes gene_type:complete